MQPDVKSDVTASLGASGGATAIGGLQPPSGATAVALGPDELNMSRLCQDMFAKTADYLNGEFEGMSNASDR